MFYLDFEINIFCSIILYLFINVYTIDFFHILRTYTSFHIFTKLRLCKMQSFDCSLRDVQNLSFGGSKTTSNLPAKKEDSIRHYDMKKRDTFVTNQLTITNPAKQIHSTDDDVVDVKKDNQTNNVACNCNIESRFAKKICCLCTLIYFVILYQLCIKNTSSSTHLQDVKVKDHVQLPVIASVISLLFTQLASTFLPENFFFMQMTLVFHNMISICVLIVYFLQQIDLTWLIFFGFVCLHVQIGSVQIFKNRFNCSQNALYFIIGLFLAAVLNVIVVIVLILKDSPLYSLVLHSILLILLAVNVLLVFVSTNFVHGIT